MRVVIPLSASGGAVPRPSSILPEEGEGAESDHGSARAGAAAADPAEPHGTARGSGREPLAPPLCSGAPEEGEGAPCEYGSARAGAAAAEPAEPRGTAGGSGREPLAPPLCVRAYTLGGREINLELDSAATIADAKHQAERLCGIPAGQQQLFLDGVELEDTIRATDVHAKLPEVGGSLQLVAVPEEHAQKLLHQPKLWVTKWVDYSSKYGVGYILSDGSIGCYFNDSTKIALVSDGDTFYYITRRTHDRPEIRSQHTLRDYPEDLKKKVTLLRHFKHYMLNDTLMQREDATRGESALPSPALEAAQARARLGLSEPGQAPYVKKWTRNRHAIMFQLSNKAVQIVFADRTEAVLSSISQAVTYVDKRGQVWSHPLSSVVDVCSPELAKRLRYIKDTLVNVWGARIKLAAAPATAPPNQLALPRAARVAVRTYDPLGRTIRGGIRTYDPIWQLRRARTGEAQPDPAGREAQPRGERPTRR